jgi:hypothetical protein
MEAQLTGSAVYRLPMTVRITGWNDA